MDESRIRRIPFPLSLDNPLHKEVLEILQGVPRGKRTEFICRKITAKPNDEMSPAYRKAMVECVLEALRQHGVSSTPQPQETIVQNASEDNETDELAKEIHRNIFSFLDTLNQDDD